MWPVKEGLGIQLGYGLQGSNLQIEKSDPYRPWVFSREIASGLDLKKVPHSSETLVDPQIHNLDMRDFKKETYENAIKDIPPHLLSEMQKTNSYLSSQYIYDPSIGKLMTFGTFQFKRSALTGVVAYISGATKGTLIVRKLLNQSISLVDPMLPKKKLKNSQNNDQNDHNGTANSEDEDFINGQGRSKHKLKPKSKKKSKFGRDNLKLRTQSFGLGASIDLEAGIQQVEFFKIPKGLYTRQTLIYARTTTKIFVINTELTESNEMQLKVHFIINSEDLFKEDFSHFAPSPYDSRNIGIVDVKGNWGVFRVADTVRSSGITVDTLARGYINDFEDFSKFKRVVWSKDPNEFYIMSRIFLKKINYRTGEKVDLITANQWSRLREFIRSEADNSHGFLLTSRELLWIDWSNGFSRVLSWKHYLDSEDPSLSMAVSSYESVNYIIIHSQVHSLILLFQLKMEDGLPKSMHDPIVLEADTETTAQDYHLQPLGSGFFSLFKMTTQLEISRSLFSPYELELASYSDQEKLSATNDETKLLIPSKTKSLPLMYLGKLFEAFTKKLFVAPKHVPTSSDAENFQKYAMSFELDKTKLSRPISLLDYTTPIKEFDKFEEFDNMVNQLQEYYNANGVSMINFKDLSNHLLNHELILNFEQLYERLSHLWLSSVMAREATRDAALSLSIVYDEEQESKELNNKVNELPTKLRDLVDDWDNDYEDEVTTTHDDYFDQFLFSQQPTIKLTQSQPATQKQPKQSTQVASQPRQKPVMKPTASQHHKNDTVPSSQRVGSQTFNQSQSQKKKKRRIKGFA